MGVIEASTCSRPGSDRKIELSGSRGSVILREDVIERLVIDDQVIIDSESVKTCGTANDPEAMGHNLHARQIDNFIDAILGEDKLLIDAKEGRRALALIEKIYEKSKKGEGSDD
jgi:predicted dehydrogenase